MAGRDNKKSTTEEFIRKAKGVHGDKYDYSKVDYVRAHAKVEIGCKVHGAFLQAATSHLDGKGCPYCRNDYIAESKRMTTEQFVERAMKTHGDKGYDYSRVDYVNAHTPITIVCPVHGEFKQRPNKHLLSPTGCKKCKHAKWGLLQRKGTERFIEEARLIHGDRYDYSVTQYSGIDSRLSITCKIHGSFEQFASSHLAGHGCARCGFIDTAKARTKTQQEFIDECKSAHLDKYDYSKTAYSGIFNTITVVCKEHGDFTVIAASHRGGTGCPECSSRKSKLERDVESIVPSLMYKCVH